MSLIKLSGIRARKLRQIRTQNDQCPLDKHLNMRKRARVFVKDKFVNGMSLKNI